MSKSDTKSLTKKAEAEGMTGLMAKLGLEGSEMEGFEPATVGGLTKWIDLKSFQTDPNAAQSTAVKGTGGGFAGILLTRQEMADDNGEPNANGERVRFFYTLRLVAPCPVTYKDEDKVEQKETAQAGDIVAIGERHHLKQWRELCDDGGIYAVVVRPHSRIKIGGGHTMWTFDTWKKVVKAPMKIHAEVMTKPPY